MKSTTRLACGLIGLALGTASAWAAGNPAAGKELATKQCATCHGADGGGTAKAPALKGRKADYLVAQLSAYKSGARKNPMMEMMAKRLSDQDMADVAAYFAGL